MSDSVMIVTVVGLIIFGVTSLHLGLRTKIKAGPEGVSGEAE